MQRSRPIWVPCNLKNPSVLKFECWKGRTWLRRANCTEKRKRGVWMFHNSELLNSNCHYNVVCIRISVLFAGFKATQSRRPMITTSVSG